MPIWVDADACPTVIKDILYRAAERAQIPLTLVANQALRVPNSKYISAVQVSAGFDVADNEIVRRAEPGDLVITSDIPLAAELIEKGAQVLSPRGERFSPDSIKAKLTMRNFMDTMRSSGIHTGGPPAMSQTDRQQFANHLDRWIAKSGQKK